MSDVHYPRVDVVPLERPGRVPRAEYVAVCSCGWRATVRHPKRATADTAAIAHAREGNRPPGGHP